jgi:hypothetical protein
MQGVPLSAEKFNQVRKVNALLNSIKTTEDMIRENMVRREKPRRQRYGEGPLQSTLLEQQQLEQEHQKQQRHQINGNQPHHHQGHHGNNQAHHQQGHHGNNQAHHQRGHHLHSPRNHDPHSPGGHSSSSSAHAHAHSPRNSPRKPGVVHPSLAQFLDTAGSPRPAGSGERMRDDEPVAFDSSKNYVVLPPVRKELSSALFDDAIKVPGGSDSAEANLGLTFPTKRRNNTVSRRNRRLSIVLLPNSAPTTPTGPSSGPASLRLPIYEDPDENRTSDNEDQGDDLPQTAEPPCGLAQSILNRGSSTMY